MEHCRLCELEPFLADGEWKANREFEGVLREAFQNEEKLNSVRPPAMLKNLHGSSSSDSAALMSADQWSSNKTQAHPTRSGVKLESFASAGEVCRNRALLETERMFFNNKVEETFVVSSAEAAMSLMGREKATLLLDPMTVCSRQALSNTPKWCECKEALKHCHMVL